MNHAEISARWSALGADVAAEGLLRVSPLAPTSDGSRVALAADAAGRRHLLVEVAPGTPVPPDRRSLAVTIQRSELVVDGNRGVWIDVVLHDPGLSDVFGRLVVEMIDRVRAEPTSAPAACHSVLARWRQLLRRSSSLGPEQLAGLFGELWHLEQLVTRDPSRRIDVWRGPRGDQHDFRRGDSSLEVKTCTHREGRTITVHGLTQLEPPDGGRLHLAFTRVEEAATGRDIDQVLKSLGSVGADERELRDVVAGLGWTDAPEPRRFVVTEHSVFEVDTSFPRLVRSSFGPAGPPPAVLRVSYDIDLTGPLPTVLTPPQTEALLQSLATGP